MMFKKSLKNNFSYFSKRIVCLLLSLFIPLSLAGDEVTLVPGTVEEVVHDGEGGGAGVTVPFSTTVVIPQGVSSVKVRAYYFSREYPEFTNQQSQFDDIISYGITAAGEVVGASINVNSLDPLFQLAPELSGISTPPGGTYKAVERTFLVGSETAIRATAITLDSTAQNVSDADLGSGIVYAVEADAMSSADTRYEEPIGESRGFADPVNPYTGAFDMSVTDLSIPGRGLDFNWTRSYSSNVTYPGTWEMGTAWSSTYLQRLLEVGDDIDYMNGAGRVDTYKFNDGVTWLNTKNHYLALSHNAVNFQFDMVGDGETVYAFHDFSTADPGRLKSITDRFGNTLSFAYSSNRLSTITDTYGRVISFAYNADNYISDVTDFNGRVVSYTYYTSTDTNGSKGQIKECLAPEVTITGGLSENDYSISGQGRKTTTYTYAKGFPNKFQNNRLLTITDPKGQTYLQNIYSTETNPQFFTFNRIVRQTYGTGDFKFYYYNDNAVLSNGERSHMVTLINDRRGLVKEIKYNDKGNIISERQLTGFANPALETTTLDNAAGSAAAKVRATDPDSFDTLTTFDAEGKSLVRLLPRGNSIINAYNTTASERHGENNLTSIIREDNGIGPSMVDETNLVTINTYETNFQLIDTMQDPNANIYNYIYDYEEATLGDQNGDGDTSGTQGLLVRINYPTITLGLAATENGGSQSISEQFVYNAFGQLTKHIDGEGREITYEYYPNNDPDGDGVTVPGNPDTTAGGYLKRVIVDPGTLALTTNYEYDDVGNVTKITDPRGNATTFTVNELNQVVRILSPVMDDEAEDGGAQYEKLFSYDANDNILRIATELENSFDNGDANNSDLSFILPNHFETVFTYDILDNVKTKKVEVLDDNHTSDGFEVDLTTTYDYDASENLILITYPSPSSDQDQMEYDERDLLFRTTIGFGDPNPSITTLNYDANGNLEERIHPNTAHIDQFQFDGFDRVEIYDDVGIDTTVTYTYDLNSNITNTLITGSKDHSTPVSKINLSLVDTFFDQINRPYQTDFAIIDHVAESTIGTATSEIKYDRNSLVVKTVNPNNHATLIVHDTANRTLTVTDAVGNIMTYIYDANSNVTEVQTAENFSGGGQQAFTLKYRFDELNRLRETEDDLTNITHFTLDSRGLPANVRDGQQNEVKRQFDGLGRKIKEVRDALENDTITLEWLHDERSRLKRFRDGGSPDEMNRRDTTFDYDSHNRLILRTNADTTTRGYQWDVESNLEILTRENGHTITYGYDDSNRLTTREYKNDVGTQQILDEFGYNGLNAMTRVAQANSNEILYERDSRNLIFKCSKRIEKSHSPGTFYPTRTFVMSYDDVGNILTMTYPSTRVVQFDNYNAIELLGRVRTNGFDLANPLVVYAYDGYGRPAIRDLGSGIDSLTQYDAVKRIKTFLHQNVVTSQSQVGFIEAYDRVHNKTVEVFINDDLK